MSILTKSENIIVVKRNGSHVQFDSQKIDQAIENAFRDVYGIHHGEFPCTLQETMRQIAKKAVIQALKLAKELERLDIEKIQDLVEQAIMEAKEFAVARSYIIYREERNRARLLKNSIHPTFNHQLKIMHKNGVIHPLDIAKVRQKLLWANSGLEAHCSPSQILEETLRYLYDGATTDELHQAMILSSRIKIENNPAYNFFTARLLLQKIYAEAWNMNLYEMETDWHHPADVVKLSQENFISYIHSGIENGRLSKNLLDFNLKMLSQHLQPHRDLKFQYLGLQILYDRYLIHEKQRRLETPQYFWMRIAMGLALNENEKEKRAIEFYDILSQFYFISSTPTLFNSATCHPQLSSCYLSTVADDLSHIFKVIGDNAQLSKWAGGIGNDWTNIRAMGAFIQGTNGLTQGVIPFLKVVNDTAVAVNQGGKRKGAVCAYLETWHLDIEEFLELRKNTGDERRRTHDMNTANWIPDLFMQRVSENGMWTLFNPIDTPDLHQIYGSAFSKKYQEYEEHALSGKIAQFKRIPAADLWRKMLTMLYETGHPWITFKDPCNIRSPQKHMGTVHCSNLCTEITLNTSEKETAVCNLGSINLAALSDSEGRIDEKVLSSTIKTAIRMLDNVIDINFYPTEEAKYSNFQHRPIGLGIMGFQDLLYRLRIPYDTLEAVELSDYSMEQISYYAIQASIELARERGSYSTYTGSTWEKGLLPIDTIETLAKERTTSLEMDRTTRLDWQLVRQALQKYGIRHSNIMAIAPTATIAHITGVSPSIEPAYSNLFSRSNLSGEFISINPYLIKDLIKLNLWNEEMLEELKYFDGSIQAIEKIPSELKRLYKTAFEIDPIWLVESASRRQKWLDMSQSLNLYFKNPTGKKLSETYFLAWKKGLKTTYYLRSLAATQIEKSTVDINKKGIQPRWMKSLSPSSQIQINRDARSSQSCGLNSSECESCQ